MKRFLIVSTFLIFISFSFVFTNVSLGEIFSVNVKVEGEQKKQDLGFVCEKYNTKNYIKYMDGDCVVGECITLPLKKSKLNKICDELGLMITNKYNVDDGLIIEGVSSKVPYFLSENNFNVQISVKDKEVVIGSPIIYGSY